LDLTKEGRVISQLKVARLFLIRVSCGLYLINTAAAATLYVGLGEPYSTIQSAANAALSGDTISVLAGTYNESVSINKRLTIGCSGSSNCIVAPNPTNTNVFNIGSGGSYSSIDGFTITSGTPVYAPVNIQGSNVSVTNSKISGGIFGIDLLSGSNSITNNEIYSPLHHGVLVAGNDNDVANNYIHNSPDNGVQVQSGYTGNSISGNTISNCGQYGVLIDGTQTMISGNTITNNQGGILIDQNANANRILSNTINNNADRAIFISSSNNVVDSNSASYNNGHSIIVYAPGTGNVINNNNVQYSGQNGIQLNWGTTANVVTNNNVQHAGRLALATGIYLANSSGNTVQYNNVGYSSEHGIEMDFDSPNNLVANNIVRYSAAQGILAWECYNGGNEIRSNDVEGNGQTYTAGGAIQAHGHDNLITGNWVHDNNNADGIAIYPAGEWGPPGGYTYNGLTTHNNDVIGNTVSGLGGNNGIVLNTATYTTVKNNTALFGLQRGIYIEAPNTNENSIYFNAFKGSANQISNTGSSNTWSSASPENYAYDGGNYTSYIGNYWSDYSGVDPDGDGVGMPAYRLGNERDNYPLMQRIAVYSGGDLMPYPAGDYDNDGVVDTADYVLWRDKFGTKDVLPNDLIGGTIGQAQYYQWRANFGNTVGAGSGLSTKAVPEPAAIALALLGLIISTATSANWPPTISIVFLGRAIGALLKDFACAHHSQRIT
jgi:parallel beta-helix repeat protein